MLQPENQGLLARVAAALTGVEADESWAAALRVLREFGIQAVSHDGAAAWLALDCGGRRVALTSEGASPAEAERETLSHLLSVGLHRAAEQDERRRINERMELLSAATFEGIFVHENGVVTDANARFAELLGYAPSELLGPHTMPRCVAPEDLPGVILLTSGNVDPSAERRLAPDSFQGFLRKPFSMTELMRAIESALTPSESLRP